MPRFILFNKDRNLFGEIWQNLAILGNLGDKNMEIYEILAMPERKTLEFKQDLTSIKPIIKTLVAFANTSGGTLTHC